MHREGGHALLPTAWTTDSGKAPAGVGLLTRRPIALTAHDEAIPSEYRQRIVAGWVGGVVKGGIHVISTYLFNSEGLTDRNRAILAAIAALIRTLRGPWVLAGDFAYRLGG